MIYNAYITITGIRQGVFRSSVTEKGREGKIRALSVNYGVSIPRDAGSGLATGRRAHRPLSFSLEWDNCSPQLFAAAYTNESLKSIVIEYYGANRDLAGRDGIDRVDHTVVLTNASISDVFQSQAAMVNGVADGRDLQTVTVTFQKIEINGATSAADQWS